MSTIVTYKVRPEHAAENRRLIESVFAELNEREPGGFGYASYLNEDGLSFVQVFTADPGTEGALQALPAFQQFVSGIAERCEFQPVPSTHEQVGSYVAKHVTVAAD